MKPVFEWVYAPQSVPKATTGATRSAEGISARIEQAFDAASASTGTSFDYLVKTAQRESAMNPEAKARTSSASGLFQFVEQTWLETVKLAGPSLGLKDMAARIVAGSDGRYRVPDPQAKAEILALRHDPEISAMMAGALTQRNATYLTERLGRRPSEGELYVAHFLGARGAAQLIGLAERSPEALADYYFPEQAAANKPIFYERGQPRSVAGVYAELVAHHERTGGPAEPAATAATAVAALDEAVGATGYAPLPQPRPFGPLETARRVDDGWKAASANDAFAGLFRTDGQGPSAGAAQSFWQSYSVAPALFEVAADEDTRAIAAEDVARALSEDNVSAALAAAETPRPQRRPSPSLAAALAEPVRAPAAAPAAPVPAVPVHTGPLDLSSFLTIQNG